MFAWLRLGKPHSRAALALSACVSALGGSYIGAVTVREPGMRKSFF